MSRQGNTEEIATTRCNYLYGVVRAGEGKDLGSIGMDGAGVRTISDGTLGMVASRLGRLSFSSLSPERTLQCLAQHQRVLEQVMLNSTVIPIKFGTYADDDGQILEILDCGRRQFAAALEKYAGKVEVDLAAFWADLKSLLEEIALHEAVVSMKTRISSQGGPTTEQRIELGRTVKRLLDERRDRMAGALVVELRKKWPDVVVNPTMDDSMILSAAVLVCQSEQSRLDAAVEDLNRGYGDRVNFRCVGPLPPYSFATAEVRRIELAELDAARRILAVSESAGLADIKTAYRRLLQESHPDRNPGATTSDRIKAIFDAYRLLEEYAAGFQDTSGAFRHGSVIVTVRSLGDMRARKKHSSRHDRAKRVDRPGIEAA